MAHRREQPTSRHHQRPYPVWSILGMLCMSLIFATSVRADIGRIGAENETPKENGLTTSRAQHSNLQLPEQTPKPLNGENNQETPPNRVAIIGRSTTNESMASLLYSQILGGGIGGISVAHFLVNDDNRPNGTQLTVFEKEAQFGGRIHFTRIYGHGTTINTAGYTFDADDMLIEEIANFTSISLQDWSHNAWNTESRSFLFYMNMLGRGTGREDSSDQPRTNVAQSVDLTRSFAEVDGMSMKAQKKLLWNQHDRILTGLLGDLYDQEEVTTHLSSKVTRVTRYQNGTFGVHWTQTRHDGSQKSHIQHFDNVVIATPYHQAALEVDPPLPLEPERIEYKPIHATSFISERLPDSLLLKPYGNQWRTSAAFSWPTHFRHQIRDWDAHGLPFISVFRDHGACYAFELDSHDLTRVISGSLFSNDDITALFERTQGEVTFPDQACSRPHQAQPKRAYPKCGVAREEFALEAAAVDMSSDCVEKPTVAWIYRDYWPNGVPVIQRDGKGGGDDGDGRELVPGMFYVNGFEGREGASMSKSIASGRKVKDLLAARCATG